MSSVHVAITHEPKPGKEADFEAVVQRFIRETLDFPGVQGALVLKPPPGTNCREYGILRTFENDQARESFYASPAFAALKEEIRPLIESDARFRRLHGLEAFFRDERALPPPRWKMAVITWAGVYPSVVFWNLIVGRHLTGWSSLLVMGVVSLLVVPTLTWVVMPALIRIFGPWLNSTRVSTPHPSAHGATK